MSEVKFRISIIDFMPFYEKVEAGKDKNGEQLYYGDLVVYNEEDWFIGYRYGSPMLKQPGMMAMISAERYKDGVFDNVEKKKNTFGAGVDWLIIGHEGDPFIDKIKLMVDGKEEATRNKP